MTALGRRWLALQGLTLSGQVRDVDAVEAIGESMAELFEAMSIDEAVEVATLGAERALAHGEAVERCARRYAYAGEHETPEQAIDACERKGQGDVWLMRGPTGLVRGFVAFSDRGRS